MPISTDIECIETYHTLTDALRLRVINRFCDYLIDISSKPIPRIFFESAVSEQVKSNILDLFIKAIVLKRDGDSTVLICIVGTISRYFEIITECRADTVNMLDKTRAPEFWMNVFNRFSEEDFKAHFSGVNLGVLWFYVALHYDDIDLFLKWLSLGGDFYSLPLQYQNQAAKLFEKSVDRSALEKKSLINNLAKLKDIEEVSGEPSNDLIGKVLSPFKNFLKHPVLNDPTIETSETYYRSERNIFHEKYKRYEKLGVKIRFYHNHKALEYGGHAHAGNYINPLQLLGDTFEPPLVANSTNFGDSLIYNALLNYQRRICQDVIDSLAKEPTTHIQVGFYNDYPCLMVYIKFDDIKAYGLSEGMETTKESWANLFSSFFTGIINAAAVHRSMPIEMVRRSSFGFLIPSVAPTKQSFRINVGIVPDKYGGLLVWALKSLDKVAEYLVDNLSRYPVPEDTFCRTDAYRKYIGDSEDHNPILTSTNILHVLWSKAEKTDRGQSTLCCLTRTPYALQVISSKIFNGLLPIIAKPVEQRSIFIDVLVWALKQIKVKEGRSKFSLGFNRKSSDRISYDHKFDYLGSVLIAEEQFWLLQKTIINRLRAQKITIDFYHHALAKLEECCRSKYLTEFFYSYFEVIQQSLLAHAIQMKKFIPSRSAADGYGSDSDEEGEIESRRVFARKIITHNGMRAIWGSLLGIRHVHLLKDPSYSVRMYIENAYYEVSYWKKTIAKLHDFDRSAVGSISKADTISKANICIIDLNPCVTDGTGARPSLNWGVDYTNKILILDATSATTDECRNYLHKIVASMSRFKVVFFISSGLKFEQFGSDNNHYGTIRIFARDKATLKLYYDAIKEIEKPVLSSTSHALRRTMKKLGCVPVNSLFFRAPASAASPSKEEPPTSLPDAVGLLAVSGVT